MALLLFLVGPQPILDFNRIAGIQPTKATVGIEDGAQLTNVTVDGPEGQMTRTSTVKEAGGAHVIAIKPVHLSATIPVTLMEETEDILWRRLQNRRSRGQRRRKKGVVGKESLKINAETIFTQGV